MSVVEEVFGPLYGNPCWNVQQGYGSFLTFEFGEPHLRVRGPYKSSSSPSGRRRLAFVAGDWHLWLYMCTWRVLSGGQLLAHSESPRRAITKAARELKGQCLLRVTIAAVCATTFEFDLGGRVETAPAPESAETDEPDEQWLLRMPDGRWFTLRADGQYAIAGRGSRHKDEWLPPERER